MPLLKIVRTFTARGLTGVALVILTYYVSRRFGLERVGFVNLAWLILLLVSMFAKYGIEYSGVKHLAVHASQHDANAANAFINANAGLLLLLLTVAVPVAILFSAGLFVHYPLRFADYALFTAVLLVYGLLSFIAPLHRGLSRPDASYYFDQGGVALILLALIAALVTADGFYTQFLAALLLASSVMALLSYLYFRGTYRKQFAQALRLAPRPGWAALRDGLPYFLISLAEYFLFWSGLLLLGVLDTGTNVGIYSVLIRTVQLAVVAMGIINALVSPRLATLQARSRTRHLRSYVGQIWKLNFALGTLSIVGICLLAPFAFRTAGITPDRYINLVFLCLLLPQIAKILLGPVGQIMAMSRAGQHALAKLACGSVVVAVLLGLLLIPPFSILGAALAYGAGLSSYHLGCLLYIRHQHGFYTFEAGPRLLRKLIFGGPRQIK